MYHLHAVRHDVYAVCVDHGSRVVATVIIKSQCIMGVFECVYSIAYVRSQSQHVSMCVIGVGRSSGGRAPCCKGLDPRAWWINPA